MKNIFILLSTFLYGGCFAQPNSNMIITLQSSRELSIKDSAIFTINNSSKNFKYYYVSVEAQNDVGWQEVILDINENADPRSVKILKLNPTETRKISLKLGTILKIVHKSFNTFRLKISYGERIDSLKTKAYSASFFIKR
jgi:hypothetical protein